jgi:hypothetical protein
MERLGPKHLLSEAQLILLYQMQEEQDKLTKEVYEMMVNDKDI